MKRRPRIYYSDSQKALMWERWKQGATLHEIGKLFDRPHTSIHRILAETGGFRPAERSRASTALTLAEREEISRALVKGESIRSIACRLNRAPSTISREIKRNGGSEDYRASQADEATWGRARRPKRYKLSENRALARIVADKLRMLWSPEQIAGWLKHTYPRDESHHVSHETISLPCNGGRSSTKQKGSPRGCGKTPSNGCKGWLRASWCAQTGLRWGSRRMRCRGLKMRSWSGRARPTQSNGVGWQCDWF